MFYPQLAVSFNQCNGWLGIGKGSYPEKGFHKIYQMDLHQVHDEQKRMLKETDHMLTRVRKYLGEKNGKIPSKLREKANRALMEMKKSLKVYKIKLSVKPLQGATGRKILVDIHETLENFHHTLDKIAASTDPNYSKIKYRLRYLKQKIKRKLAKAYDKTKKVAVGAGWRTMGFEDDDDDPEEYTDIYLRPHRHIAHYAKTGQKAPPDLIVEPQRMPYQGPVNHLPEPTIAQSAAPAMALMPVQSTNGVMMIPIHSGMLLGKNGAFTSVPASDQEKKGDEEKKSDDDKQSHQLVSSEHLKKLTQATQSNQGDSSKFNCINSQSIIFAN